MSGFQAAIYGTATQPRFYITRIIHTIGVVEFMSLVTTYIN
jgi:hypothetical protein